MSPLAGQRWCESPLRFYFCDRNVTAVAGGDYFVEFLLGATPVLSCVEVAAEGANASNK